METLKQQNTIESEQKYRFYARKMRFGITKVSIYARKLRFSIPKYQFYARKLKFILPYQMITIKCTILFLQIL